MYINGITKKTRGCLIAVIAGLMITLAPHLAAAQNGGSSDAMLTDFLKVYNFTTDKIAQLAEAMPEDKLDWRPAEGIRSVREAVLHVAGANYFFGSQLGATVPDGVNPQAMEKSNMSKKEAIDALKKSVTYIQNSLNEMTEKDFETEIDFFGNTVTKRQAMFALGTHAAEHLGQLIAYARSNGVTPPWSQQQDSN